MAHTFLDANCAIELLQGTNTRLIAKLEDDDIFISTLSIHIMVYVNKIKIPNAYLSKFLRHFEFIDLGASVLEKSLKGPTNDLEDNIQIHSALSESCDLFITRDKKLLNLNQIGHLQFISPDKV